MKEKGLLKPEIASNMNTIEGLKPYAVELKEALDGAFKKADTNEENAKLFTNQKVTDTSVLLATMMGWLK